MLSLSSLETFSSAIVFLLVSVLGVCAGCLCWVSVLGVCAGCLCWVSVLDTTVYHVRDRLQRQVEPMCFVHVRMPGEKAVLAQRRGSFSHSINLKSSTVRPTRL